MPELPEVETVRTGLARLLPGKEVAAVRHDWHKSFPNAEEDVEEFLIGAKVAEVRRRAKVLLIELDSKYSLVIHLKMTGQLVYLGKRESPAASRQPTVNTRDQGLVPGDNALNERFGAGHPNNSLIGKLPDKTTRVTIDFVDGSKLFFNDQRKFGWVRLLPTAEVPQIDFFRKVGPEPLSAEFTPEDLQERLSRRKNSNIKSALIDQTVIAGIGNIYADESLWGARIHPLTLVKDLSQEQVNTLFIEIRKVMELAIEKGGSTDRNYVDAEGKRGSYLTFANVFRREDQPCPRHPDTLVIKTRVAGRGTHTCPKCQKLKT